MSDGVINSRYGAHEYSLDLSSEIVSHNKSLYVKKYPKAKAYRIKTTQYSEPTIRVEQNSYSSNAAMQQGTSYNDTTVRVDQNSYNSNAAMQQGTSYNGTTVRVEQNSYSSNAAMQQGTSYNDTTVRVEQNSYSSNAAMQQGTSYNDTTVRVDQNSYNSNAAMQQGTSYNGTTVRVEQNSYSSNAAMQQGTSYNDTTVRVDQNSYNSNAAMQQGTSYNGTTVRVDQNSYNSSTAMQQGTTYINPTVNADQNTFPVVAVVPTGSILFRRQLQYHLSKNRILSVLSAKKVLKPIQKGTQSMSFLNSAQSYQNDVSSVDKTISYGLNKTDNLVTKANKVISFKKKNKLVDVKDGSFSKYLSVIGATNIAKKLGKKGISAFDEAIVSVSSDDSGGQMVVQLAHSAKYAVEVGQITGKTIKATVNTTRAATKSAVKTSAQVARTTAQVSAKITQTVAKVSKAAVTAISQAIATMLSNPVILILVAVILLIVIIIIGFGSIFGGFSSSSYSGTGNTDYSIAPDTSTANDVSDVYDYINKAIAVRNLHLLDLQDTWTGYLKYDYKYQIEKEDGSVYNTSDYPVADCAPIMAYLAVNYKSYDLSPSIKADIDNIVNSLYTFDYKIEDYSYTEGHGSHTITYTGKKITFIVKYHNAKKYFDSIISDDKKANYSSILQYGDRSYFRLYNILSSTNWHEYIGEQYGYAVDAQYNSTNNKFSYELKNNKKLKLNYKNSDGTEAGFLYSPLSGKVKSISSDDDYDYIITLVDDDNKLECTIYAEFSDLFTLRSNIKVGAKIISGDVIASRKYPIYFTCKSNNKTINPMLLMEYYQHAD